MAYREKTNATEEREMTKESKHSEGLLTMSSRAGKKIPVLLRPRKFQEKKDKKEQEQQDGLL